MTIRFRNRITLAFFIIAVSCLMLGTFFTLYQFFSKGIVLPEIYTMDLSDKLIFRYYPVCTFTGIFILLLYICITTLILFHSFEKTQAPDIVFFLLFLFACLCDTSRLLVPVFQLSGTFSRFLLKVGNINLFARLLAPLALMGNTLMSTDEFRQSTDRNCLILIITAMFFAEMLPLNTAVILPNFCISYGYQKAVRGFSLLLCLVSAIALFRTNSKNEYKQIMTLGFLLLSIGYSLMFYSFNIASLVAGTILLGGGTYIYLNEVHKHYLWID